MAKSKRPTSLADQAAELGNRRPKDFDPEETSSQDAESDESASDVNSGTEDQARNHYVDVEKSKLRKRDVAPLGSQYKGSRVRREDAFEEDDDDPFGGKEWEYAESSDSEVPAEDSRHQSDAPVNGGYDSDTSGSNSQTDVLGSDEEDSHEESDITSEEEGPEGLQGHLEKDVDDDIDRNELRRIMAQEQRTVAASISQAAKADVEKGKAVKKQRSTFDSLLNVRIRLQKSLIASNSVAALKPEDPTWDNGDAVVEAAEKAAFSLWNTLNELRASLQEARTGSKRKCSQLSMDSSSEDLWSTMREYESTERPHRQFVLNKWSAKSRGASAVMASSKGRLNSTAEQRLSDVLSAQLLDSARLVKRTRMARSCAPSHVKKGIHESRDIYDDADFYGILLKELLEQRGGASAAGGIGEFTFSTPWRAAKEAKTKKVVDTKASKGRKLRYTVHEKLQNLMAPEDRGAWGERQVNELFGSLFGRKLELDEDDARSGDGDDEEMDGIVPEEKGLMLFRS